MSLQPADAVKNPVSRVGVRSSRRVARNRVCSGKYVAATRRCGKKPGF
ncbi:hypothetical protein [Microcoleus sp. C2D2]